MRRIVTTIALIALLAVGAIAAPTASAEGDKPTPLSDEPSPLSPATPIVELYQAVPDTCTPLTDGDCAELVNTWLCPAGLSADAKARQLADIPYNVAITLGAVAYVDTHCQHLSYDHITVTAWADVKLGIKSPTVASPVPAFTG